MQARSVESLRRIGVIAWAESRRSGGRFTRKTLLAFLALTLAMGALSPMVMQQGLDFDHGLYRVAVTPDAALAPAARADPVFTVVDAADPVALLRRGDVDVAIAGDRVHWVESDKGDAAVHALREAAADHTFRVLLHEEDQNAAFPVRVEVAYMEQAGATAPVTGIGDGGDAPTTGDGGNDGGDGSGSTSGGGDGTTSGGDGGTTTPPPVTGDRGGFQLFPDEDEVATPDALQPPFPFRSLLLAYLFLIPMNFVVQVYAGSSLGERLGRKGEALLASPATPWEIIVGKATPYFVLMMLMGAGIALWLGAGWLSVVAIVPLVLVHLALEFVAAMFARSYRELTFLTVFASVSVTVYAFLPAVFSEVHPIALISPISLVVMDLRGTTPGLAEVLWSTLPLTLVSLVLYVLAAALYREEDLFHQKPPRAKLLDSVARQVRSVGSAFKLSVLLIPFVFVVELLLVTFLFAWPIGTGLLGVLLAVALVEEAFKALPSFAAHHRGVIAPGRLVAFGALAGLGFFAAEKGFLLASLAGLFEVNAASAVFLSAGAANTASPLLIVGLLLMPLVLHVVTAATSAYGAQRGRFAVFFTIAVGVHVLYNLAVIRLMGGGGL